MTVKKKFMLLLALMAVTTVLFTVGVWALKSTSFTIGGNINFTAPGIQATISKGTLNYDEAWVTASDENTKMPEIKITNSSTENTLKSYYDQWKGLDLVFNEDGDDVVLTFTITNDSDNENEYINAEITANAGTSDNATVTPSPTSATIAAGEANKQTFTITFHITDTDYNASLTGFSIGVNLSYEKIEPKTMTVYSNNTSFGTATTSVTNTFLPGDSITLTATPKSGYTFMAWAEGSADGNYVSQDATYTFTATKNTASTYYAIFNSTSSTYTTNGLTYTLYNQSKTATLSDGMDYTGTTLTVPSEITVSGITYKVKEIGFEAFTEYDSDEGGNCGNWRIRKIIISEGINILNDSCFENMWYFTEVDLPSTLKIIGDKVFYYCDKLSSITIPDSVTSIGSYAFGDCRSFTTITIPDSVTSMGNGAFDHCTNLTSVTIGSGVTHLSDFVFSCTGLTNITIPENVTSIGSNVFQMCNSLTTIIIPDSVTSISNLAFNDCSALTFNTYDNAKYLGNSNNPYVVLYSATSTNITSCAINENCKVIYSDAFSGCSRLTGTLTIPEGVTSINYEAFKGCSGFTGALIIPDRVLSIGSSAFYNCSGFTSLTIGNGLTSIGEYVFYNCSGLKGALLIPDSVTSIGTYAFYNCSGFTSLTIGNGVTNIGERAFDCCDELTTVYIDSPTIAKNATSHTDGTGWYLFNNTTNVYILTTITDISSSFRETDGVNYGGYYKYTETIKDDFSSITEPT